MTIILDDQNGIDVAPKGQNYTYVVPSDGKLILKSFAPFRQMHMESACYDDGTEIPMEYGPAYSIGKRVVPAADQVALRNLGAEMTDPDLKDGSTRMIYVVGTVADVSRVNKLRDSGKF